MKLAHCALCIPTDISVQPCVLHELTEKWQPNEGKIATTKKITKYVNISKNCSKTVSLNITRSVDDFDFFYFFFRKKY